MCTAGRMACDRPEDVIGNLYGGNVGEGNMGRMMPYDFELGATCPTLCALYHDEKMAGFVASYIGYILTALPQYRREAAQTQPSTNRCISVWRLSFSLSPLSRRRG